MALRTIANDCVKDVVTKINAQSSLTGKVWHVLSDDELLEKTKGLQVSCAAVIYAGLRASGAPVAQGSSAGMTADLAVDVLLVFRSSINASADPKLGAVTLLDNIRSSIAGTRAPSGHYWRFSSERLVEVTGGVLAYVQRWNVTAPLA